MLTVTDNEGAVSFATTVVRVRNTTQGALYTDESGAVPITSLGK